MRIITIHGIRRKNRWYETLANFKELETYGVKVHHFEYGYLDIFRFLMPHYRNKIINHFQEYYSKLMEEEKEPPSIVL